MNELDQKNKIELTQEKDQKQEYKLIGWENLRKGCKLYSYNPKNRQFKRVEMKAITEASLLGRPKQKLTLSHLAMREPLKTEANYKAMLDPNCLYVVAINPKNAARKINMALKEYGIDQKIVLKK